MITVVQYVEYAVTIPGLQGPPILIKVPAGFPPPVVTASQSVVANNPVVPLTVKLPAFVNRRRPCSVEVGGVPRVISASVAILLEAIRRGGPVRARHDTLRKFAAELPEFAGLVVRDGKKVCGGMVPVTCSRGFVE